jgi:hypothetical protein
MHERPAGFPGGALFFGAEETAEMLDCSCAKVAELVDAQDLGSCGVTRPGSSPGFRMRRAPTA